MHHAIYNTNFYNFSLLNGCLYLDADNAHKYLTLELISAIINYNQNIASSQNLDLLILIYKNNRHFILFNDWENPNYFKLAFPTLLSLGTKDHFVACNAKKMIKIFLQAWEK